MSKISPFLLTCALALGAVGATGVFDTATAATADDLTRDANRALLTLTRANPAAAAIASKARAVLIFPTIVKAGFVFGGAFGEGVLESGSHVDGYYNSLTGSWGLQAGAQSYSYVVFLMTRKATDYLSQTAGWEFGVGPTVVVVDEGMAKNLSTSTLQSDAYAFTFGQEGLMAGISLEGTKITRIHP
jgi:lipid-binding SYLF domain-containing protein